MSISGKALLAGVMGWPISHSRSPCVHGYWLEKYAIDGAYVPLAVVPDRFEEALKGLQAAGFRGPPNDLMCAKAVNSYNTERDLIV